jgi:ubiquinol-cytochrome c reductase cytochrome c subunit
MFRLRLPAVALLALAAATAMIPIGSTIAGRSSYSPPGGTTAVADEAAAGQAAYTARCGSCHGPEGQGTSQGPSLVGVGAASADFQLRTGRMPFAGPPGTQAVRKPPAFDDQTIRDLVAYVASLGGGPAIPQPRIDAAALPVGQRLFIANCAPCHGATARGGAVGGGALAPALDQATPVQVAEALLIGPGEMPVFSGFSESDRDAVVTYVRFIQTQPNPGGASIGGIGPVPEGFAGWVLGLGLILVVVLIVGHDWRARRTGPAGRAGSAGRAGRPGRA